MHKLFTSKQDIIPVCLGGTDSLGEGSFAKVQLVTHRLHPNQLYAMKTIRKRSERELALVMREIKLHASLKHQHIIEFIDYIEDNQNVFIFLEYAKTGDLFAYLHRNNLNEE